MLVVIKVNSEVCNLNVPKIPMSMEIRAEADTSFTLIKQKIDEEFGELNMELKVLGLATRPGYWPKQIITQVEQKVEDDNNKESSDDEEDDTDTWH